MPDTVIETYKDHAVALKGSLPVGTARAIMQWTNLPPWACQQRAVKTGATAISNHYATMPLAQCRCRQAHLLCQKR